MSHVLAYLLARFRENDLLATLNRMEPGSDYRKRGTRTLPRHRQSRAHAWSVGRRTETVTERFRPRSWVYYLESHFIRCGRARPRRSSRPFFHLVYSSTICSPTDSYCFSVCSTPSTTTLVTLPPFFSKTSNQILKTALTEELSARYFTLLSCAFAPLALTP